MRPRKQCQRAPWKPNLSSLPNQEQRWIPDAKIRDYLLNTDTPKGQSRHKFFVRFGFTRADWTVLKTALMEHAVTARIEGARSDQWGTTWRATGPIVTPDGRNPVITAFWIVRTDDPRPQLTSVVPVA